MFMFVTIYTHLKYMHIGASNIEKFSHDKPDGLYQCCSTIYLLANDVHFVNLIASGKNFCML